MPETKMCLVVGGSGSGKTRFFCKPNLHAMLHKFRIVVVTDPKGSIGVRMWRQPF